MLSSSTSRSALAALRRVHEGEAVRRLERPDLLRVEEDEALLPPRDHPAHGLRSRRAPVEKTPEASVDAVFGERLEDVVDDAEIERLQAVLRGGNRKDEHGRQRVSRHRANQIEARVQTRSGRGIGISAAPLKEMPLLMSKCQANSGLDPPARSCG